ncbi:MAG: T9SS type A sorting domain-containing protein [Bacteroidota bacterium]
MKKIVYIIVSLFFFQQFAMAQQEFDQPSVAKDYQERTFYRVQDGSMVSHDHTTWDIAFGLGMFDLGIFINEAAGLSFTNPYPEVELYVTTGTDYDNADTMGMTRIFNDDVSWAEGAFNHVKNSESPLDFGWGDYDGQNNVVNGTRVFAVKLRSGVYKKIEIQSLIGGVYSFRYANLDGSNEVTQTINKSNYAGKSLVYYSLENDMIMDQEPDNWDFVFTRYVTTLAAPGGGFLDYRVTGLVSNAGVSVAQADGIDINTVDHNDYESAYVDSLLAIGHDWKIFGGGWSIAPNRVYFVKTTDDEIWRLRFIDFEGSSTGVTTLERTFESEVTSVVDPEAFDHLSTFNVFPNPASDLTYVSFDVNTSLRTAELRLVNTLGQVIINRQVGIQNGFNVKEVPVSQLPSGMYHVTLTVGNDLITQPLMVK